PPPPTPPLSLHDALPIFRRPRQPPLEELGVTHRPERHELVNEQVHELHLRLVSRQRPRTQERLHVAAPVHELIDQLRVMADGLRDRKSTRLNSSHLVISY